VVGAAAVAIQTVGLHRASHRRVARHRSERCVGFDQRVEILVVQRVAPGRVLGVQLPHRLQQRIADRPLAAGVLAHAAAKLPVGVIACAGGVVPLLQRRKSHPHRRTRHRMLEVLAGQLLQRRSQLSERRRRHQKRPDHRASKAGPAVGCQRVIGHRA